MKITSYTIPADPPKGCDMRNVIGSVGDPDLPTREQVKAWYDSLPTCLDGVVNCVGKHRALGTRQHIVEEICYFPDAPRINAVTPELRAFWAQMDDDA